MDTTYHELAPMRDDPPLTPDSIALAKRVQAEERAQATADTGLRFKGDTPYVPLPILNDGITPETRVAVAEAFVALVERHGYAAVLRGARLMVAAWDDGGRTW